MPGERRKQASSQVTLPESLQHIQQVPVARSIRSVIIHHTWRPTAAEYHGLSTVRAVRRYHMEQRSWSDNGYHIMIGPNGDIFLCRPMAEVGAHTLGQNEHSLGLAYIANFDVEDPTAYAGLTAGQQVVAALLARFDLGPAAIHFHREYASKTCPGTRLGLDDYREQVGALMAHSADDIKVVLLGGRERPQGSEVIACQPRLEGDTTRVDLRPLATGLGYEVYDHIAEEGKVYLRGKVHTIGDTLP